ncbi:MAG: hypothetical protein ACK4SL_03680 [Candidatus Paceibacteria bacterium]
MALDNFVKRFITPKAEQAPQTADVLKSLEQTNFSMFNTLNVLRDAQKRNGKLTSEQIIALSYVKDAIRDEYGVEVMEKAVAEYFNAEPESRLEELKLVLGRNDFLKSKLMEALVNIENPNNQDARAVLAKIKDAIRVLTPLTFTSVDVDTLCTEIVASKEFDMYKKAKEEAIIASVKDGSASSTKNEIFKSPYAGDVPRHIASEDPIHPVDDTVIDWKTHTEEFQPKKPPRETL